MAESKTAAILDEALGKPAAADPDEEVLDASTTITVKYRPRGQREAVVTKVFEVKIPGPAERAAVGLTVARLSKGAVWETLPPGMRGYFFALATVAVTFKDQPDHDWLCARCECDPVLLDKVYEEVEATWAEHFPVDVVLGEGESREEVPRVEVTKGGVRAPSLDPAKPARRATVGAPR